MFKGFKFDLPVYYVVTPQTGSQYHVRSLTVAEVNKLKTSLVTPNSAHKVLNEILWNAIDDKPEGMKFIDFKKSITTLDREALLYGLYHTTFGDIKEYAVTCYECQESQLISVSLNSSFSMNAYPFSEAVKTSYDMALVTDGINNENKEIRIEKAILKDKRVKEAKSKLKSTMDDGVISEENFEDLNPEKLEEYALKKEVEEASKPENVDDILRRRISIVLPISKVVAVVRQPTIYDEEYVLSSIPFSTKKQNDLVGETLVIERFEQWKENATSPWEIVDDRGDILQGYQSLPPKDKTAIFDEYHDKFGQYNIAVKTGYECRKCGTPNDLDLNIAVQLFRMVNFS